MTAAFECTRISSHSSSITPSTYVPFPGCNRRYWATIGPSLFLGSLKYLSEGNGFRHLIDGEAEKKEEKEEDEDKGVDVLGKKEK